MAGVPTHLIEEFAKRFPGSPQPRFFRAPGRVNLIGEHTDYNAGLVLPIAINLAAYTVAAPCAERCLEVYSREVDELRCWDIDKVRTLNPSGRKIWTDYVLGVAQQLHRAGYPPQPTRIYIDSAVPVGSGLSSSAALEVSVALALLWGRAIPRTELAKLCQRAENQFVGVPSGIMDQYAALYGEEGAAIRIDCRNLTHETVKLPPSVEVVAVNSMVKHSLGESAYGERVRECRTAVEILRNQGLDIESLRDVSSGDVELYKGAMPEVVYRRAKHVTTEIERVVQFTEACEARDVELMGKLFVASHRSLQYDYQVSAPELDFLVDRALAIPGVYGSRMTGGGFGGCTVSLVRRDAVDSFEQAIRDAYRREFAIDAPVYRCEASEGARELV
ncbi:MAG TPA: galactokinase [Bryobacteraceae bacterium]|nr:galactokinase [Bryobacteraceae bacterium]